MNFYFRVGYTVIGKLELIYLAVNIIYLEVCVKFNSMLHYAVVNLWKNATAYQ
jgi:hypothetical protein